MTDSKAVLMDETAQCGSYKRYKTVLFAAFAVVFILGIFTTVFAYTHFGKVSFKHPEFESGAVAGFPEIKNPERTAFTALEVEKGYTVYLSAVPENDGQNIKFNIANPEDNDIWFRAELLNENQEVIGSTGVLKQGEYLPEITLAEPLTERENPVTLRIIAYQPEEWSSRGNISLNLVVYLDFK